MSLFAKAFLAVVLILGTVLIVSGSMGLRPDEWMRVELAASRVVMFCGLVIAVASAIFLIGKALSTGSLEATLPLTVPATVGLFLVSPHWSLGVFLCVVAFGYILLEVVRHLRGGRKPAGGAETPPPAPS
jgi:hypothetical protein